MQNEKLGQSLDKWIPCKKRMPNDTKKSYMLLVTHRDDEVIYFVTADYSDDLYSVDAHYFYYKKGVPGFYIYEGGYGYKEVKNVIAWMQRPESYKERKQLVK